MTPREREIKKKYTRVTKFGDMPILFLSIDQQEFSVEINPNKVVWFRNMLSKALARMIEKEAPHD